MKAFVALILFSFIALSLQTPATGFSFPPVNEHVRSVEGRITVLSVPEQRSDWFWAMQFWVKDGSGKTHGGYTGIQTTQDQSRDRLAIFSVWDALEARPGPNSECSTFGGEGVGYKCFINRFSWKIGHTYRLKVSVPRQSKQTGDAIWIKGVIRDYTTKKTTTIGWIKVNATTARMDTNANVFMEWFWGSCKTAPGARVKLTNFKLNGKIASNRQNPHVYGECANLGNVAECTANNLCFLQAGDMSTPRAENDVYARFGSGSSNGATSEGSTVETSGEPTSEESSGEPTNSEPPSEESSGEPTSEESSGEPTNSEPSGEPTNEESSGEPTSEESSGEPTSEESSGEPTNSEPSGEPTSEESSGEPSNSEPPSEESSGEPTSEESSGEPSNSEPTSEESSGEPTSEESSGEPTSEESSGEPTSEESSGEPRNSEPPSEESSGEPTSEESSGEPTSEESSGEPSNNEPPPVEPTNNEPPPVEPTN